MAVVTRAKVLSEQAFAALVEDLVQRGARGDTADAGDAREKLIALLRESHPVYAERGSAAIVRMRGWVLLALEHVGLSASELIYVLEELDNGRDPYLIAAAAHVLRAYPHASSTFVGPVEQALARVRYHDDTVNLRRYGGYGVPEFDTTASRELEQTLKWLKSAHRGASRPLAQMSASAVAAGAEGVRRHACCSPAPGDAGAQQPGVADHASYESAVFEDHDGAQVGFGEFFRGRPSVVAFFYTRCDNPLKCSLTVSKLAHVQRLLSERGLANRIRTAAITYDPAFDLPFRLTDYAQSRAMQLDADHRMLRATRHWDAVQAYFELGVNFAGSIVNRHRIELFVLDESGRVVATFERLQWDEQEVLAQATRLLRGKAGDNDSNDSPSPGPGGGSNERHTAKTLEQAAEGATPTNAACTGASFGAVTFGTVASIAAAFFPKCTMCWTAYLSALGIGSLEFIPYAPWLLPVFAGLMLVNLAMLWPRAKAPPARCAAFFLAAAGALAILVFGIWLEFEYAPQLGLTLTLAGSFLSVKSRIARQLKLRCHRASPATVAAQ